VTEPLIQTAANLAVQTHLIERTAKPAGTETASFEAKFDTPQRNPVLGWNPDSQTITGFQFIDVVLDGEFRGLFHSGRFIRGTGYLVPDEVMETVEVQEPRQVSVGTDETVIVGCNTGHANYFHWITQALPAADYAVNRAGQSWRIRLALPQLNAWQEDSLRLLGLGTVKRLTIEDPTKQYAIGRAEYSQILNGGAAFNNCASARGTYRRLREAVDRPAFRDKKLYVARTDAPNRQMRNEQALIEEVRNRGYEVISPGSLSFVKQVQVFRGAGIVVGPHGAGMTNIVFCEPGTIVYELVPTHYINACFCNLAHICHLRYWMDTFESEGDGLPNLRHWESDTTFVLQRLDEIERIGAELQDEAKRQTISAMDFLRGMPGQVSALEMKQEPASMPSEEVGWMRRALRAIVRQSPSR
jgi:hypothetical protein